jgi:hypothetical protein
MPPQPVNNLRADFYVSAIKGAKLTIGLKWRSPWSDARDFTLIVNLLLHIFRALELFFCVV